MKIKLLLIFFKFLFFVPFAASASTECADNPENCTPSGLCEIATVDIGDNTIWAMSPNLSDHVEYAKRLGINCGDILDICDVLPEKCRVNQICERAITTDGGRPNWNFEALDHVVLAKKYGLSCGVKNEDSPIKKIKETFSKKHFVKLSVLQRKQLQFGLRDLGYYSSGIDGVWGPGTKKAVNLYAQENKIIDGYPHSVLQKLLSAVEVPKTFKAQSSQKKEVKKVLSSSNKLFECKRSNYPLIGFADKAAMDSWYPLNLNIAIAFDNSWMASDFGSDTSRDSQEKLGNWLTHYSGSSQLVIDGRNLSDSKESEVFLTIRGDLRYKQTPSGSYTCSKALATDWKPD